MTGAGVHRMETSMWRMVLGRAACMAVALCSGVALAASDYPDKPVKMVVPMAAGGGTDAVARVIASKMSDKMGSPIIVENRAGAGGQLGAEQVAASSADGYTLLFASSSVMTLPYLRQTRYDLQKDFVPVGQVGVGGFVLVLRPGLNHKTLAEFMADAKANPGKFTFGSPGIGSAGHLALNLLKAKTGIEMVHVPFKSSTEIVNALMGGQIDCAIDIITIEKPYIEAGKVRALATTTAARDPSLPDLPTFNELKAVPGGYEITFWYGMFVPRATPPDAVAKLQKAFATVVQEPEITGRLEQLSLVRSSLSPARFEENIAADIKTWRKIIEDNNLSTSQ